MIRGYRRLSMSVVAATGLDPAASRVGRRDGCSDLAVRRGLRDGGSPWLPRCG